MENLKERYHSKDLGVDRRMDLSEMKWGTVDRIHLARIESSGGLL
jgi:hypothetical protein